MKSVWDVAYSVSLNGVQDSYYVQVIDKRCGIHKNCWLDDLWKMN